MKNFLNNSLIEENKSIERTYDSLLAKSWQQQIMNNKPIRVGYNIWVHAEKGKQVASSTKWRLWENFAQ